MKYTTIMNNFANRLIELMNENELGARELAVLLNLANTSTIYKWRNNRQYPLLNMAIKLADIMNCTVDYLIGRSDHYEPNSYSPCPLFSQQLRKSLEQCSKSQNNLLKFADISAHSLNNWIHNIGSPNIDSAVKIANYLTISLDELVGREVESTRI